MRELETIRYILHTALRKARESNAKHIGHVYLALGEISGLNQDFIQDHWDKISKGTPAEQARLHFRLINAEVQCMACFIKYQPLDGRIHCPQCGSVGAKILTGEEFYLESIELDQG